MKQDASFGVIPVRMLEDGPRFLLIQHGAGHWGFPKGHPEGDESPQESALRELREETGIKGVDLWDEPALVERYTFRGRKGELIDKTVTFFIGVLENDQGDSVELQLEEVQDYAWGDAAETTERLSFDEGRRILNEALIAIDQRQ